MDLAGETTGRQIDLITDRRRPSRLEVGNPHLIALMRRDYAPDGEQVESDRSSNRALFIDDAEPASLSVARGAIFGSLIGASMWAAGFYFLWLAFW